jgi:deoxyribodipyrimidine photolyase-related protein
MPRLGLIFGDQLDKSHAVLTALDRSKDRILMGELAAETEYVWHHVKKVALIFSAMRHFAGDLAENGWDVRYQTFDADSPCRTFTDLVARQWGDAPIDEVVVSWPGEWRVLEQIRQWENDLGVSVTILPDRRFICPLADFEDWASGRKQLRMEFFYRRMRRRTGLLMEDDEPVGGQWNYDQSNRKPWRGNPEAVAPMAFTPDATTTEVLELVRQTIDGFGLLDDFDFPVTRTQAKRALTHFVQRALPNFGDFQDAMADDEDYLFHSRLSVCMNIGLLDPLEVCRAAELEWREGRAPLNAVEGFIRQIIGWREFVRGIYWMEMPGYAERNGLANRQPLPDWYWSGETEMRCLARTIDGTRRNAYAHHIQRLMVTGNFALLLGVVPKAICDWYLAVYADAYDWVELPNTLGMVMHADGGLLGSKPYAASGKYIDRMSDHCSNCRYRVKETLGEDACPFNALYWDFLMRHRERFESNHRMKMMYRNVDRMDADRQKAIRDRARWIKDHIEEL